MTTQRPKAPARLVVGAAEYTLEPGAAVVPLDVVGAPGDALLVSEDEGVAVVAAGARASRAAGGRPVYRLLPSGGVALPTGRVFLRFADDDRGEAHRGAIEEAGFSVDEVPGWAPHTAWVRATSGDVADALARLDALGRLPGVRHVEPELLRARVAKSG